MGVHAEEKSVVKGALVITRCGGGKACPGIAPSGTILMNGLYERADELADTCPVSEKSAGTHKRFSVSVSFCPNACSRPQIADVGVIGAVSIGLKEELCGGCGACDAACRERAVEMDGRSRPVINDRCLFCGECLRVCPFDALFPAATGYRVLLGGKLGRHPRLGMELPGFRTEAEVIDIVVRAYQLFASYNGEVRFADILAAHGRSWLDNPQGVDTK